MKKIELAPQFIQGINWELFKEQRQLIIDLQSKNFPDKEGRPVVLEEQEDDKLEGVINLFDAIVDYAIDFCELDEDKIINSSSE